VDHDNDLDDAVGVGIGMDVGGESDALGLGNPVRCVFHILCGIFINTERSIQDLELDAESSASNSTHLALILIAF